MAAPLSNGAVDAIAQARQPTAKTGAASKAKSPSLATRVASQEKAIAEQKALIESQRSMIDAQRAMIGRQGAAADSQAALIAKQQATLDTLEGKLGEMQKRLDQLESQAGLPQWQSKFEERLKAIEAENKQAPELPPDVVSAGDFPGSIRIPGTDAAIKFGGRVRTAAVLTLNPLGTDDRFLTNSIPVGGTEVSGEARRTNISARASRLNIEFRSPAGSQQVRTYFEGDFAGDGNSFRLRHAYAQFSGFIVGQTWSTFSDPEATPEDLDFEGISSYNVIRQPLIRYWWSPVPSARAAGAIETPAVSITGGQGVNLIPDMIGRLYMGRSGGQHVQVAAVLRQIRGQVSSGKVATVWGGGGSVSGVHRFRVSGLTDRVMYQVNGGVGIARYINDLQSLGGQDAIVDTTAGELRALPAIGWYVAYEHAWKEWAAAQTLHLRSTILWSFVDVDNLVPQPPDAYHTTNRLATNVVFSAAERVDVGLEYIYGTRANKDGQSGHANQIQLVGLFKF
jgi:hypothetical protein